jgi:hypothetical protein
MSDDKDSLSAAGYAWAILRQVQWDPERDDHEDIKLHREALEVGRKRWSWLDEAADAYEASAEDGVTRAI